MCTSMYYPSNCISDAVFISLLFECIQENPASVSNWKTEIQPVENNQVLLPRTAF